MVRRCVWSRNLVNWEALAHMGLSRQTKKQNNNNKQKTVYKRLHKEVVECESVVVRRSVEVKNHYK